MPTQSRGHGTELAPAKGETLNLKFELKGETATAFVNGAAISSGKRVSHETALRIVSGFPNNLGNISVSAFRIAAPN
jgi:hypothetical protein